MLLILILVILLLLSLLEENYFSAVCSIIGLGLITYHKRVNEDVRLVITKNKINRKFMKKNVRNYFVIFVEITNLSTYSQFYNYKLSDYIIEQIYNLLKKRLSYVFLYSIDQIVIIEEFDNKTVINGKLRYNEQLEKTSRVLNFLKKQMFKYPGKDESYRVNLHAGTGSVGMREEVDSIEELIKLAHFTMITAKSKQNELLIADEGTRLIKEDIEIFNQELDSGIKYDEFEPYFHPIINPKTMKIVGCESLLRWVKNDYRIIEAGKFKDIAKEKNLFTKIDAIIIKKSLENYQLWRSKNLVDESFSLTINLSLDSLLSINVNELKISALEYQIDNKYIEFDISESDISNKEALYKIDRLKAAGFKVSLDTLHENHMSLMSLFNVSIDTLKLDRIHLLDGEEGEHKFRYYRSLTKFSELMGYKVMSKGIENKEQLKIAKYLNVDFVQGYYFTPPLNDTKILGFLNKYRDGILV